MVLDWGLRCFSDIEQNSTNKYNYAFSVLVSKHREPQSINAKLVLPIISIGIVAYAFTLFWDNLCRNSCMIWTWERAPRVQAIAGDVAFCSWTRHFILTVLATWGMSSPGGLMGQLYIILGNFLRWTIIPFMGAWGNGEGGGRGDLS